MNHDLIHRHLDLHRVAQDGTRLRTSESAASFAAVRSRATHASPAHLDEVTRAATNPALTARHAATRARVVAQDRLARLAHALAELPDVAAIKSGGKDAPPRVCPPPLPTPAS